MKVRSIAIAGLTLSLALPTALVFAQVPGAPSAGGPMTSVPSAGSPGSNAPPGAGPIGSAESKWMSHGAERAAEQGMRSPEHTHLAREARSLQTQIGRDIASARAQGVDTGKARHQRWLGSVALQKGDDTGAIQHFRLAQKELRTSGYEARGINAESTSLNGKEASRGPDR